MQTSKTEKTFFNLTCEGVGYMNRPRWVESKKSKYIACTIQALRGDEEDKTRFDVRVVGGQAQKVFEDLLEAYPDLLSDDYKKRPTVTIGFRVGDIYAKTYEANDRKTGEKILTPTIDGRLIRIKYLKVRGEVFYHDELNVNQAANTAASDDTVPEQFYQENYGSHRE
ncbi:DUF3577 domain-containing protein [Neisseria sp. S1]|uniref:DUF3577 domain-containing protein n=1 Tax=Neisseria sp. S1 TaxID=3318354 RepID=UPI003A8BEFE9